jgi:hypothetical protein
MLDGVRGRLPCLLVWVWASTDFWGEGEMVCISS